MNYFSTNAVILLTWDDSGLDFQESSSMHSHKFASLYSTGNIHCTVLKNWSFYLTKFFAEIRLPIRSTFVLRERQWSCLPGKQVDVF